jgi:hypothetical protein
MAAIGDEVITLKAEVLRLKELMASKDEVIARKNEVIASKTAQLSSKDAQLLCKDEVIASKVESTALLSRTVEELQQYKALSNFKPAAAADNEHDFQQPISKRPRMSKNSNTSNSNCSSNSSNVEVASPLDKAEILDHVFGFVGGGDHAYTAGVSRRWRARYMQYCAQDSSAKHDKKCVTRHRSVLMTESRLQLAKAYGLDIAAFDLHNARCTDTLCQHSLEPQQVITVLRVHGVQWGNTLCCSAAFYDRLSLLQWLRSCSCLWQELNVLKCASLRSSVLLLAWLATVTAPWSDSQKLTMLDLAGCCNTLDSVKWLVQRGAQWPASFAKQICVEVGAMQCWCVSAVQWAVASGSGWLDWNCEDYAAAKYDHKNDRKQAADVLQWAHANGCPCTCAHSQQQQSQQ